MAIAMFIAFLLLSQWVPPCWKRRCVGYGLITDISVHVILQMMFGHDADGRAGLLMAGVFINITMHIYRWLFGYEKLTLDGWERFPGKLRSKDDDHKQG